MLKRIALSITATLLVLSGCSKLDTPEKAEESCDMCHATHLNKSAVHGLHLSRVAMATFPFLDSAGLNMKVTAGTNDSTFKFMVDTGYKFSNSATIDRAIRYQQTTLLNDGLKCTDCHKGLDPTFVRNSDPAHRNGFKDASFDEDALLKKHYNAKDTVHYTATALGPMKFDGVTCSNILCHGAGRKGVQNVTWNTSAKVGETFSCMSCHDTQKHKVGVDCNKCHYDVTLDNGKSIHNFRKHLNDTINYGRY